MKKISHLLVPAITTIAFFGILPLAANAQGGCAKGCEVSAPIDGGLIFLVAAGLGLGVIAVVKAGKSLGKIKTTSPGNR